MSEDPSECTATLVKAWGAARARLKAAGIDQPAIDARLMLEAAANATRTDIVTDPYRLVTAEQSAMLDSYLARRERREPISHILGRKGFWKIMLNVTPDVLTPRPDTETIVEAALRDWPSALRRRDLASTSPRMPWPWRAKTPPISISISAALFCAVIGRPD